MRPLLRLFILAVLAFLFIFLVVFIFRAIFSSPVDKRVTAINLPSFADTDVQVRYTIAGQINGNDEHRQIVMTIGRDQRTLAVNAGYEGTVLKSQTLDNNTDAYKAFLYALNVSGFTRGRTSKIATEQGQCPLGQRYIYEVINNGGKNMRTWSTSCSGPATFRGRPSTVRTLFQNQFANYSNYTSNVQL